MVPVPHEVFADDTVFVLVVLDRSVLPDSVNHGLPVFFLNNQIREVAYKVTELTVCKSQHFLVRPCGVEHLKGDVLALYLAAKVAEYVVGELPEWEVPSVLLPAAGDFAVVAS